MTYYIFDGSYNGFLTAVFECFERKEWNIQPIVATSHLSNLFAIERFIISDDVKADRVLQGMHRLLSNQHVIDFYRCFLSEDPIAWRSAFYLIQKIFTEDPNYLRNYRDDFVIYFSQTLKKVSRERHRMKAFIRFQKSTDGMYIALIDPDFNVLPLIHPFFKNRYADQSWIIYDTRRNYGLMYDLTQIIEIELSTKEENELAVSVSPITLDSEEQQLQNLWKQYFKSTNIEARRNIKLHLKHVPRRYWKNLVEKN